MRIVKGLLVVMNGDCKGNLAGVFNAFIPTRDRAKALDYVKGNGDIIGLLPYEIDIDEVSDAERTCIIERLINLQN